MADVFLSYASADRERARALAEVLVGRGWTVWWDRTIAPGRVFDEVIQEELNAAKCIVVLWSPSSVKSNWVKTEAAEAAGRGSLVPALLDDVAPPIEFKRIQAANLTGWEGQPDHPELATLLASVERLLRAPGVKATIAPEMRALRPRRRTGRARLLAGGGLALAALVAAGAWLLRGPVAQEPTPTAVASNAAPTAAAGAGAVTVAPPAAPPATARPDAKPAAPLANAAPPSPRRINLLSPDNGGQVVAAAKAEWAQLIDGGEDSYAWVDAGEGVFAFKDERPARFDTFAVFVPGTDGVNLKAFELLAGDDSPTGPFTSIGKFETQNLRLFKSPYQEFPFPSVTAKYLKVRSLGSHGGETGAVRAYEFQLFGELQ